MHREPIASRKMPIAVSQIRGDASNVPLLSTQLQTFQPSYRAVLTAYFDAMRLTVWRFSTLSLRGTIAASWTAGLSLVQNAALVR